MERRNVLLVWMVTTVVVAAAAFAAYDRLTAVPYLAGRGDPARLLTNPELLFEEPGMIGSAVELRVTEAVAACMADAGFAYRGPAPLNGLDDGYDPAADGYGIAAALRPGAIRLSGSLHGDERARYEAALYGAPLGEGGTSAGCAAVGSAALAAVMAEIEAFPYPIARLEADALSHPAYLEARAAWSACMADRGYTAQSPEQLIAGFAARLSGAYGDEARALAEEERLVAAADFTCRSTTIDRAIDEVAADLAPRFVEANRSQLEDLVTHRGGGDPGLPEGLGTGDVQVTLVWDNSADLDLYVTDPTGETVYYGNQSVSSGGTLDRDANRGCDPSEEPVENVFWPPGGAPSGSYTVTVDLFGACGHAGPLPFRLIVRLDGRVVESVTAALDPNGEPYTTSFEVSR